MWICWCVFGSLSCDSIKVCIRLMSQPDGWTLFFMIFCNRAELIVSLITTGNAASENHTCVRFTPYVVDPYKMFWFCLVLTEYLFENLHLTYIIFTE